MAEILLGLSLGRTSLGKIIPKIIFKRKLLRSLRKRRAMAMHSSRRKFHTHCPLEIASSRQESSQHRTEHEKLQFLRSDIAYIVFTYSFLVHNLTTPTVVCGANSSLKTSGLATNVNGAASKEEEIDGMVRGTNASCRIITETCLRPGLILNYPCKTVRTDNEPGPDRPAGDVAIFLPQNVEAKIVRRYVQNKPNALWVRIINSVDIVPVHVRPVAEKEAFTDFMEDVRRRAG